jgi:hypothetical protein
MAPQPVIEYLDVFKDVQFGLGLGGVLLLKGQLGFGRAEKTFDGRIVKTVPPAVHSECTQHLGFAQ